MHWKRVRLPPPRLSNFYSRSALFSPFKETDTVKSLAYMESHLTVAHMFRPGAPRMTLHDTEDSDIMSVRGYIFSLPKIGARGLRVLVEDAHHKQFRRYSSKTP